MFSKKSDSIPGMPSVPKSMASGSNTFSVLGADMSIKGDVEAATELHVEGRIEGDIRCASLVQGEGSEIHGAIHAESARLSGTVRGSLTVRDLVILKSASIEGDVHYDALTIEQGAHIEGRFTHSMPGTDRAIESRLVEAPAQDDEPTLTIAS